MFTKTLSTVRRVVLKLRSEAGHSFKMAKALPSEVNWERRDLYQPDLHDLAQVIERGISQNFESVSARVFDCPDLSEAPFGLAATGICGRPTILDVGGVPYLIPMPDRSRVYSFDTLAKIITIEDAFFIGAGAGGCHLLGVNSEMMANLKLDSKGSPFLLPFMV